MTLPKVSQSKQKIVQMVKIVFGLLCQAPVQEASISEAVFSPSKGPLALKTVLHQRLSSIKCVVHQMLSLSSIKQLLPLNIVFHWTSSSIKSLLRLKEVFNWKSSSIGGHLPSGHHPSMLSSIKGRLLSKVIFHQSLSSIKGCLYLKVIFHWSSSSSKSKSIEWHIQLKGVFHLRSSSIDGHLL